MHQDSNRTLGQSVQVQNINSNTMNTLVALTMVQQSMTELSCDATEQENFIVITKVVLRLEE
jgi:hypothetical protein